MVVLSFLRKKKLFPQVSSLFAHFSSIFHASFDEFFWFIGVYRIFEGFEGFEDEASFLSALGVENGMKNLENTFSGHGGYPQPNCTHPINIVLKFEPLDRLR